MKIELDNQWSKKSEQFDVLFFGIHKGRYLFSIMIGVLGFGIDFDFIRGKR